ncbi:hypothetical protein [Actibacterium sp. 188UL27-1]|uniref:hypothetical protein n=1 Tax=Actibacterium sp. 188UL27-1 TaxID=2786961 RepID=UPI001958C46D|nr:hypothetical protein [Actibacterium sp. 188UL27-1]MBM7069042.1 hypothetical protein [Actibacterium sp. 188UL27-1]
MRLISCFFNPTKSRVMRENFRRFVIGLGEASTLLHTVECIQPGHAAELSGLDNHIVVRSTAVLWHKERLLNIALHALPPSCDAVMWLDGDIIFENPDWLLQTRRALEDAEVVQPFEYASQWPVFASDPPAASFASRVARDRDLSSAGFAKHGHTGYVWAIRREVLNGAGLFDEGIVGSGDHVMAHAFCEDRDVGCLGAALGANSPLLRSYRAWRRRVAPQNGAYRALGSVPGRLRHLRHGSYERRQYLQRCRVLNELGFDPRKDLTCNQDGCWEWCDPMGDTARYVEGYFQQRQDDKLWIGMQF